MGDKCDSLSLPQCEIALQSQYNSKYSKFIHEKCSPTYGFLKSSGEKLGEYEKFEAVPSTIPGLVHMKSTYNNKYWRRQSKDNTWIVALADDICEDSSKWCCTLFRPVLQHGTDCVRFICVQNNCYARVMITPGPHHNCLSAHSETPDTELKRDVFVVQPSPLY